MKDSTPVISVKGLNKSFGQVQAVADLNLELRKGEICGFLGPNGGGKTTSLRMLCGLLKPDSGTGQCLGYNIILNSKEIKKDIGYMPQKFSLYENLTVFENLDFIGRLYHIPKRLLAIDEIISTFNLKEHKDKLAKNLSGGLKQRLSLGSCLLHKPKLLLLDEPTGGVDSQARRGFWDQLFLLSEKGITTLISTHYMDEAERCTHLAYISKNLIAEGSVPEILKKAGLTTWKVEGDNLVELSRTMKHLPGIDEVAFFGHELHISGKNKELLLEQISKITKMPNYKCTPINTSLEDALMCLIKNF